MQLRNTEQANILAGKHPLDLQSHDIKCATPQWKSDVSTSGKSQCQNGSAETAEQSHLRSFGVIVIYWRLCMKRLDLR